MPFKTRCSYILTCKNGIFRSGQPSAQKVKRARSRLAIIELIERLGEQHLIRSGGSCSPEQRQTGPKLEIIGRAKNFQCGPVLVADHPPHIVTQAAPKKGVG